MTVTSGWAINGPSKTQVEDARRLSYTLSSDAHGVATLDDLRVVPMDPPGPGVQVTRGSAMIKSRYDEGETYLGSHNQTVTYATTQTPSNQGRSDLVVMRVEDPWARNSPWPEPAEGEADETEFFPVRIIEGVAPTTNVRHLSQVPGYENQTGIVLYRIDRPANTATIDAAHLVDLRRVARPRRDSGTAILYPEGAHSTGRGMPRGVYGDWPLEGDERPLLDVPEWAAEIEVTAWLEGVWYAKGSSTALMTVGGTMVSLGGVQSTNNGIVTNRITDAGDRRGLSIIGTVKIPQEMRGTRQRLALRGCVTSGSDTGAWWVDYQSCVSVQWTFKQ